MSHATETQGVPMTPQLHDLLSRTDRELVQPAIDWIKSKSPSVQAVIAKYPWNTAWVEEGREAYLFGYVSDEDTGMCDYINFSYFDPHEMYEEASMTTFGVPVVELDAHPERVRYR